MDMITHVSENEYHADFSVLDVDGEIHDGHIEVVVDRGVAVVMVDGEFIL